MVNPMKNYNHPEHQYLCLLRDILTNGSERMDRTGVGTRAVFGRELRFLMDDGFPAITTKKLAFRSVVGELIGFIRGYDNASQFRELGCKIWDQNANVNAQWLSNPHRKGTDDLGSIYGVQWRRLPMPNGSTRDQLAELIHTLRNNPSDRRMIVWAYNVANIEHMALPPCHMGFQCFVDNGKLSLKMEQRSVDSFLGLPFNIASYAVLLHMLAQVTGLKAHELILSLGDTHIYSNHIDAVNEQLSRTPYPWTQLLLKDEVMEIDGFIPENVMLVNYRSHGPIRAPMAV